MIGRTGVHDQTDPGAAWADSFRRRSLAIGGVAATIALAALLLSLDRWVAVDDAIWRAALLARGCGTDAAVERAVEVATTGLALLLVAAAVLHVRAGGLRSAMPWLVTWLLGLLASKTLKHVFTRDRPSALPDLTIGYSFPSAHVMNGVVAAIAVVALADAFRHRARWRLLAAAAAATLAGGRVLLGRHWTSDVLGGVLSALVLCALVIPASARRPVAVPVVLAAIALTLLLLDQRLGEGGWRLPSPLVARGAAIVDVDVGPEMTSPHRGGWREAGLERPFGSYLWLEGEASLVLSVEGPDGVGSSPVRLAIAGRPQKTRGSCSQIEVTLNGQRVGRFVAFVGWREYRLPIPEGVLHAGDNELVISARGVDGPARFGVTYARIAVDRSAAE